MPFARKQDPATSHVAAATVQDITATKLAVLRALKRSRTDVQILEIYLKDRKAPKASESGIRSRRAELVRDGFVVDSGSRMKLDSGRMAIVWRLTTEEERANV